MKFTLTAKELNEHGAWLKFCKLRGINEGAMNEGLVDGDEEFEFTLEEMMLLCVKRSSYEK